MMSIFSGRLAYGQSQKTLGCGATIEKEFSKQAEVHTYFLEMVPRESFTVSIEPVGEYVVTHITAYDPAGLKIAVSGGAPERSPLLESNTLSARGKYRIEVTNGRSDVHWAAGKIGLYVMSIGCIKSDGTVIKPSDTALPTPTPTKTGQTGEQKSLTQESTSKTQLLFLEVGQTYEIAFGSQTKIVKLVELRNDGWAKVEVESRVGWLNINQVALIIPIN